MSKGLTNVFVMNEINSLHSLSFLILTFIFILLNYAPMLWILLFANIEINEVMANPKGGSGAGFPEDRNEFVELYNTGTDTVNLAGYFISDGDAKDSLIPFNAQINDTDPILNTTFIPPGTFAVILDPEYPDSGNGEYVMPYDFPHNCILLTVGNTTIGDGLTMTDPLFLLSNTGDTVSTYRYPLSANDGYSIERINPLSPDTPDNWKQSMDTTGSTPGRVNSVYRPPGIVIESFLVSEDGLSAEIHNEYSQTVYNETIKVFIDDDWDNSPDEYIAAIPLDSLSPDARISINYPLNISDGFYRIGISTETDTAFRFCKKGIVVGDAVINEIMYQPNMGNEYVEIYNRSTHPIDFGGWHINEWEIPSVLINTEDYLVLCKDYQDIIAYYGNISGKIMELSSIALKNTGDTIRLMSPDSFLFDESIYTGNSAEIGHSLEKVNPDIPSDVEGNWGYCVDEKGGTPGEKNSIYLEIPPQPEASINIAPKHFTPDGDGIDDRCVITLSLPFLRNDVKLIVFDRLGRKRKIIEKKLAGGKNMIIYNGKDDDDNILPMGIYILYLMDKDMDSDNIKQSKTTFSIGKRR